jgi:hypothetical protein
MAGFGWNNRQHLLAPLDIFVLAEDEFMPYINSASLYQSKSRPVFRSLTRNLRAEDTFCAVRLSQIVVHDPLFIFNWPSLKFDPLFARHRGKDRPPEGFIQRQDR